MSHDHANLTESQLAGLRALIEQDKKIEAIKLHREWTGAGLAEAKAAIEVLQGHTPEDASMFSGTRSSQPSAAAAAAPAPANLEAEIVELLRGNHLVRAIKRYREANPRCDLKQAKQAVIAMGRRQGVQVKSGCFVATAVFEDAEAPAVNVLREWRDESLVRHPAGRIFIHVYEVVGPKLAVFVNGLPLLRPLLRPLLAGVARCVIKRRA